MDVLYIVVPAYNEAENIENLINSWYPIIEKNNGNGNSRLLIINDGSKDSTFDIVEEYMKTRPMLSIETKENGGHGSSVLYGYRYAIENNADYIFQTDSDCQTSPMDFEDFWKHRKEYDAIIGNRTDRQDGLMRVFIEKVVCLLLRIIFGVIIPDANAPFRLMKKDILCKYIGKLPNDYNLPNIMFTTYFVYYKENIRFLDISFKPRQAGVNSINLKKIIKIGFNALKDFYKLRKEM